MQLANIRGQALHDAKCWIARQDSQGRELARISLVRPDGLESTEGLSEFVVISAQLSASLEEST